MKRKSVLWLIGYFLIVCSVLGFIAVTAIHTDPFFHYHKPATDKYFYPLNNERSQNDGIVKHFDYTGLITGTSMTENFKTTEAESLWGGTFVKASFSGALYKETNDNLETALKHNPELRIVIRGLDMDRYIYDKNQTRLDLGQYPIYLYDNNVFNDVKYLFNRDVVFSRIYPMIKDKNNSSHATGITSFDQYANWMKNYNFGKNTLFPDGITLKEAGKPVHLTEEQAELMRGNIEQNVISTAKRYPNVQFLYFFTPYSAAWWMSRVENGTVFQQIEAERIFIEEVLQCSNIKLFSFNCKFDITTDMNHYKDPMHYAEWINSMILRCMYNNQFLLTADNYNDYLEEEQQFYTSYDYSEINNQPDYDDDYYAAFLLAEEAYGIVGHNLDLADKRIALQNAELIENQHEGKPGILCTGNLKRNPAQKKPSLSNYMRNTEFVGFTIHINDITPYKFITFYGRKISDQGQPTVYVYNSKGKVVARQTDNYKNINNEWKQYIINVSQTSGEADIIFNGGYVDNTGSPESRYVFSDIMLY